MLRLQCGGGIIGARKHAAAARFADSFDVGKSHPLFCEAIDKIINHGEQIDEDFNSGHHCSKKE